VARGQLIAWATLPYSARAIGEHVSVLINSYSLFASCSLSGAFAPPIKHAAPPYQYLTVLFPVQPTVSRHLTPSTRLQLIPLSTHSIAISEHPWHRHTTT
jgi:hypothetical protein